MMTRSEAGLWRWLLATAVLGVILAVALTLYSCGPSKPKIWVLTVIVMTGNGPMDHAMKFSDEQSCLEAREALLKAKDARYTPMFGCVQVSQ